MTKSSTNQIYLKSKLFGFKMLKDKNIDENMDEFNKTIIDLQNIGEKIDVEDQAVILLNFLSSVFNQLEDTINWKLLFDPRNLN